VLTDLGPFRSNGGGFEPLKVGPRQPEPRQPAVITPATITDLAADAVGHIWVGTNRGVYLSDGDQWWERLGGRDGVPYESTRCLHLAPNGDLWAGTSEGAWRMRDGRFRYFWGRRWLTDNDVRAIWTDAAGRVWIESQTGVACIEERPMTLAKKAAYYDRIAQERHNRRGYIAAIDLKTPGEPTHGAVFDVSDNDGLWTALYVAATSLRFGATRDPAARDQARRSMNALLDLERLSGIPGFPARAMVTDDELKAGVQGFNPEARVHAPGEAARAWYRSSTRPGLWCKGDTSSDELDGHYFAWYLYHGLVADEAEQPEIAAVVRRVTDGIMRNNYTLVDHTGRKTRWGIWSPELINHDPFYAGLRPLNSLEILSYLKVAENITGDRKYAAAADRLIQDHHYLLNGLLMRRGERANWPDINHSDDELLYLAYYPLMILEKDPPDAGSWSRVSPGRGRESRASSRSGSSAARSTISSAGRRPARGATSRRRGRRCRTGPGIWSPGRLGTPIAMMSRSGPRLGGIAIPPSSTGSSPRRSARRRAATPIHGTPTGEATAAARTTASPGSSRTGWACIKVSSRTMSDRDARDTFDRDERMSDRPGRPHTEIAGSVSA
jgi:hypothetical protein